MGLGWPSSVERTLVGLAWSSSVEHKMTQSFGFGRSDFFRFIDLQEVVPYPSLSWTVVHREQLCDVNVPAAGADRPWLCW